MKGMKGMKGRRSFGGNRAAIANAVSNADRSNTASVQRIPHLTLARTFMRMRKLGISRATLHCFYASPT